MYIIFIFAHTTIVEVKRSTLFDNCRISKFNRKGLYPYGLFSIIKVLILSLLKYNKI